MRQNGEVLWADAEADDQGTTCSPLWTKVMSHCWCFGRVAELGSRPFRVLALLAVRY